MKSPAISIVLPLYNGKAAFLEQAVASLVKQTFADFEIVIVDDGSQNDSLKVVQAIRDSRIRIIKHRKNMGLATTLNTGIQAAKGRLIARMDQDDLSHPKRLERQSKYLQKHRLDLIGTWYEDIDDCGQSLKKICRLTSHSDLKKALLVDTYFCHGSLLFIKNIWETARRYDRKFDYAEDYDFISRVACLPQVKLGNVPRILYQHRVNICGMSLSQREKQENIRRKISKRNWRNWKNYYCRGYVGKNKKEKQYQIETADRLAFEFRKRGYFGLALAESLFRGKVFNLFSSWEKYN